MGPSGESICIELDAAGIEYELHERVLDLRQSY